MDLYDLCETIPWTIVIQERRLKWFGHMLRLPDNAPARIAFEEATNKPVKKVRGGQPLQWIKTIQKDLKPVNVSLEEAKRLAVERDDTGDGTGERGREYKNMVDRVRGRSIAGAFPDVDEETSTED